MGKFPNKPKNRNLCEEFVILERFTNVQHFAVWHHECSSVWGTTGALSLSLSLSRSPDPCLKPTALTSVFAMLCYHCHKPRGICAVCAAVGSFPFHSHHDERNPTEMDQLRAILHRTRETETSGCFRIKKNKKTFSSLNVNTLLNTFGRGWLGVVPRERPGFDSCPCAFAACLPLSLSHTFLSHSSTKKG